jgi:hypothetical protein
MRQRGVVRMKLSFSTLVVSAFSYVGFLRYALYITFS